MEVFQTIGSSVLWIALTRNQNIEDKSLVYLLKKFKHWHPNILLLTETTLPTEMIT